MEIASPPPAVHAMKLLTGIAPVDRTWGGFYRGGSYLLYGRAFSGRDLLPLRFVQTGAQSGETGLLLSAARPKDLIIQAASIGFDLRGACTRGQVRLMRMPPVLRRLSEHDDDIARALGDLVAILRQGRPQRLVIHDFMPFTAFQSYDRMRTAFVEMLEQTDVLDMTTLLVMPQPANAQSARVIDFMKGQVTATLHVEMDAEHPDGTERRLVLMPNIGHLQRQTVEMWDLRDVVEEVVPPPHARYLQAPSAPSTPPAAAEWEAPGGAEDARQAGTRYRIVPLGAARQQRPPDRAPGVKLGQPAPAASGPAAPLPGPALSSSAGGYTAGTHFSSSLPAAAPVETPAAPRFATIEKTSRAAFATRLQQQFDRRDAGGAQFLLVALRIEPQARQGPFDFETLSDLAVDTLRPHDDAFVDAVREHLIIFLADARPEEQHAFFTRFKARLREQVPQQAEGLIQAVSAFVVPDGQPFSTAEDFLRYVLDGG